jgi:hypothetical protein
MAARRRISIWVAAAAHREAEAVVASAWLRQPWLWLSLSPLGAASRRHAVAASCMGWCLLLPEHKQGHARSLLLPEHKN